MTSQIGLDSLSGRSFYRFTGPPENWLTAIKYMTWGLEEKYLTRWKKIQVGDVFFMHSTVESLFAKNPRSAIVGLGVVGGQFRTKNDFLWVQELRGRVNRWPLLVPFSEIYLFSLLPSSDSWEPPGISTESDSKVPRLIQALLKQGVPTRELAGGRFPVMGSWSGISNVTAEEIFQKRRAILYSEFYELPESELLLVKDASAVLRCVPSLKFLDGSLIHIRKKRQGVSIFERDNELLERAEDTHRQVLDHAFSFFKKQGFDTWSNQHVDLFAESEKQSFLVEVKSTVNHNFRIQARRAVGQLLEYEHFDIRKHFEANKRNIPVSKILMVNDNPSDTNYSAYLNTIKIDLAWPQRESMAISESSNALRELLLKT
jgi:hypothetical protein